MTYVPMNAGGETGHCEECKEVRRVDVFARWLDIPYPVVSPDEILPEPRKHIRKLCQACAGRWADQIKLEKEG